jgi:hypothetical protein
MALSISGSSPSFSSYQGGTLTSGTIQATTSGTSFDFTSIPSWVKRITVMFTDISTNGSSLIQVQLGAGSVQTTGYTSVSQTGGSVFSSSSGLTIGGVGASDDRAGFLVIATLGSNIWVSSGTNRTQSTGAWTSAGNKTLGGTLDRLRITTVNGTDTFDAGSINILYE